MKVSVLMITYNQEKFIAQALDSVLMQDVNFDYEIVIGEDCSTDATREIVLDYQRRYPEKIRALLPDQNLGMLRNFAKTYQACEGEYVAILEGDDFWTCPSKLQKQADFLDKSSGTAICFHRTRVFYEDESASEFLDPLNHCEFTTIENLLEENYIQTCSVMFRNKLFGDFPDWFFAGIIGDYPLHILNAGYGNIGYIDEVMGAYRIHFAGVWSMQTDKNFVRNYSAAIKMYEHIDAHFQNRFRSIIRRRICRHELGLCEWHIKNKNYLDALLQTIKLIRNHFLILPAGMLRRAYRVLILNK